MSIIRAECIDQTLQITNAPLIASGDIQTDVISFSFCPMWDGYLKTAVFFREGSESYAVLIDENSEAVVPKEVLEKEGSFFFGVHGVNGDRVKTSQAVRYRVVRGAVSDDASIPDPTADVYSQIMAKIDEAGLLIYYATEAEISQMLESSAEGNALITLSRLNQYHKGITEETGNNFEYGGA